MLERAGAGGGGTVLGCFGSAVHVEIGGFVIVIQLEGAPRMPNGLGARAAATGGVTRVGDPATLRPGRLAAGRLEIAWDAERPPAWSASVPRWGPGELRRANARAAAIARFDGARTLAAIGGFAAGDEDARRGLRLLLTAAATMDAGAAAEAAALLIGRGTGLTPVGDDVLAAAALTMNALSDAAAYGSIETTEWLAALVPTELGRRTTPISATLLRLASEGDAIGPAGTLLDPRPMTSVVLAGAVKRLAGLGHSTGVAYLNTIRALMMALAAPPASHPEKEHVE